MRIISWNINSIGRRFDELKQLVESYDHDYVCLQKVRNNSGREKFSVDGYHPMFTVCDYGDMSGVMTYAKIESGIDPILQWDNFPKRILTPELSQDGHLQVYRADNFYLINAYVPYANAQIEGAAYFRNVWDSKFKELVINLSKELPVIICGDLNIVHTKKDTCEDKLIQNRPCFSQWERDNFDRLLAEADLADAFRELHPDSEAPTYFGNFRFLKTGNRIDYFIVSRSILSKVTDSEILNDFGTGQSVPITLDIEL